MKQWELMEDFLLDRFVYHDSKPFTNRDVADFYQVSWPRGSRLIQEFLRVMLSGQKKTDFMIRRDQRTKRAVWHLGTSVKDLRAKTGQTGDDITVLLERQLTPYIREIVLHNPRAVPQATHLTMQIGGLVHQLANL